VDAAGADQDLTRPGEAREPRGRIDRVAKRREVSSIAFPDAAHERVTGVHPGADRNPRLWPVVAGLLE
jgi:hypothetical protein